VALPIALSIIEARGTGMGRLLILISL
jgi:hypothetical protein